MEQIKQLLFTMTKQERETMREKYKAKITEPLTNQFPERASKDTAVKSHRARKQLQTKLFPSGTIFLSICIKRKNLDRLSGNYIVKCFSKSLLLVGIMSKTYFSGCYNLQFLYYLLFQNIPRFMTGAWVRVPPPKRKPSRNPSLVLPSSM